MFSLYLSDRLVQFIRNVRRRWTLSVTDTFLEWFLHRKKQIETIYFLFYWRQTKYLTYPFYLCLNPLLLCPSMIKDVGCLTHQDLNKKTNQQKSLLYPIQILQTALDIPYYSIHACGFK